VSHWCPAQYKDLNVDSSDEGLGRDGKSKKKQWSSLDIRSTRALITLETGKMKSGVT
jgi:hypothetical protein